MNRYIRYALLVFAVAPAIVLAEEFKISEINNQTKDKKIVLLVGNKRFEVLPGGSMQESVDIPTRTMTSSEIGQIFSASTQKKSKGWINKQPIKINQVTQDNEGKIIEQTIYSMTVQAKLVHAAGISYVKTNIKLSSQTGNEPAIWEELNDVGDKDTKYSYDISLTFDEENGRVSIKNNQINVSVEEKEETKEVEAEEEENEDED